MIFFPSSSRSWALPSLLLLLAAGCSTPGTAPESATPAATAPVAPKPDGAFDDDQHPTTLIEAMVIAAGKDPVRLAVVERDLVAVMREPGADPALVQEAAQHLGYVMQIGNTAPAPATLVALDLMLSDPAQVDYARLALDRVPGPRVDAVFLTALRSASGRTRLALIESVAARGLAAAVPILASGLHDADPAVVTATAQALGRIGGQAALAALESAKDPLDPAVLNARLAAAARINPITAARIAGEIHRNAAAPLPQRTAALRLLIEANPVAGLREIGTALSGPERAFHQVAIEAVATLPVADAAAPIIRHLSKYTPEIQVALITALAHRNDASSVPGLVKAYETTEGEVRLAAIDALGRLPGNKSVVMLLGGPATGKGDEAKAAFASLSRLNGPGVDEFILERANDSRSGNPAVRAVYIQLLAARNQTEAIPFLLGLRTSPTEELRLEALDALRAIASAAEQPAIIAWAVGATSKTEQTRAVRALITIILRDGAIATRADTVIAAIKAGDAPARVALLPVLSRVAGPGALAAAGAQARDADEGVATTAAAELTRWPDADALPVLVDLAGATRNEKVRATAVQGASRFLAQNGNTTAQRSAQARALLDLPLDTATRQSLIHVLSLCADEAALAAAKRFLADPATAAAARDAVDAITSSLAGPPVVTASITTADPALMADGNAATFWQVPNNEAGTWIRADLHSARPVRKITLNHSGRGWGYPEKFEVQVSDNPDQPGAAVLEAEGDRTETVVTLPTGTRGRYVWLRLTERRDPPLAISELRVE